MKSRLPLTIGACLLRQAVFLWCGGFIILSPAGAATNEVPVKAPAAKAPVALATLSFEQLSQIKIISVSKREEKLSEVAAAVYVITGEDIRRSGALSIPEALRLAPGVDVARINAQRYAVSVRGFNNEFANKLLVLQDGRSLYSPLSGGTFWDAQDTFMEDIDRIEVVRGPGGTAWGINAVNGVINIITKDARETQGTLVTGGGGLAEQGFGGVRQGGQVGEHTFYRVYAKAFYRDEAEFANGAGAGDDWSQARTGFRLDSYPTEANHLTLQGDLYDGKLLQYSGGAPNQFTSMGGNLLGRFTHEFSEESELKLQLYYDAARRDSLPASANTDTGDFEASHRFALGARQQITWGVHYRYLVSEARGGTSHYYDPAVRALNFGDVFVEDQVTLVPERLRFSAGTKLEHNDFTGWAVLPNARLSLTPTARQTLWAAVSRGLQAPSISDYDLTHNIPGPVAFRSLENRDRPLTELIAYELGYRAQWAKSLTLDLAVFYNDYSKLATDETAFLPVPPTVVVTPSNRMHGETYGFETTLLWQATDWWRWRASYSLARMQLHLEPGTTDTTAERAEGASPQQQVMLWSSLNLGKRWDFDAVGRFVDRLPAVQVRQYFGLDLRLAFRPRPNLECAITGQNLLSSQHEEYGRSPGFPAKTEIPRGVYGKVTWSF
jgi:iron complex outermembrane recepter protein